MSTLMRENPRQLMLRIFRSILSGETLRQQWWIQDYEKKMADERVQIPSHQRLGAMPPEKGDCTAEPP